METMDIIAEGKFGDAFEKRKEYTGVTGAQEAIVLPASKKVSVALSGTYSAKLEYTVSPMSRVNAGTALWLEAVANGSSIGLVDFSAKPAVTALRINITSGDPIMEIYAG